MLRLWFEEFYNFVFLVSLGKILIRFVLLFLLIHLTAFAKDMGLYTYWNPFIIIIVLITSAKKEPFLRECRHWIAFF